MDTSSPTMDLELAIIMDRISSVGVRDTIIVEIPGVFLSASLIEDEIVHILF